MSSVKVDVKRRKQTFTHEELSELSKNVVSVMRRTITDFTEKTGKQDVLSQAISKELIDRIIQLEAHNTQLKSIVSKLNDVGEPKGTESLKRKRPFDFTRFPKQHIAIKLLYLGWDYQGFAAIEDSSATIEHHLFAALTKSCLIESQETSNYSRCGRTDKTVSSFDQVVTITVRASKEGEPPLEYCKILNRLLPRDIRVVAWRPVPEGFSARFDCKRRTYKYYFPRGDLDLSAMKKGAEFLLGTHDFRNLCKMDVANGVVEFIRTIENAEINEMFTNSCSYNPGYDMCELTLTSKGFLWHQVRCIVGVLVLVGRKLEEPEVIQQLLDIDACPRKPQYCLAIGEPLNLFHCEFELDGDWTVESQSLTEAIQTLQQQWALHTIKGTMIGQMLRGLESLNEGQKVDRQSSGLLQGTQSKNYTPLMQRPTCESLETRIAHYVEKKRLEINVEEAE